MEYEYVANVIGFSYLFQKETVCGRLNCQRLSTSLTIRFSPSADFSTQKSVRTFQSAVTIANSLVYRPRCSNCF